MKMKKDREYFKNGLAKMVELLKPKTIIVYGAAPDDIFKEYKLRGINIIQFDSYFSLSHSLTEVI